MRISTEIPFYKKCEIILFKDSIYNSSYEQYIIETIKNPEKIYN